MTKRETFLKGITGDEILNVDKNELNDGSQQRILEEGESVQIPYLIS